jgi:1-aminocyclopropane-1-carboxylate deaminase/D-cysteine desulfhydrase-like pyridoxal-dependent ACC family enzyme
MDTENRPVLTGLVALVGVAVVIGLLGGLAVLVGVKATGIGESSEASDELSTSATFRLPRPSETSTEATPEETAEASPGAETTSEAPATGISLTASQQSVSPMQQIDLTGTYQAGEGAILQVQRMENGAWSDFPVTMSVSGGTFATYVQTSRTGPNKFRVVDTDSDVVSNEVTVTVG